MLKANARETLVRMLQNISFSSHPKLHRESIVNFPCRINEPISNIKKMLIKYSIDFFVILFSFFYLSYLVLCKIKTFCTLIGASQRFENVKAVK